MICHRRFSWWFLGLQSEFLDVDLSVRCGTYSFSNFPQVRGCSSMQTLVRQEQNFEFNSLPDWYPVHFL